MKIMVRQSSSSCQRLFIQQLGLLLCCLCGSVVCKECVLEFEEDLPRDTTLNGNVLQCLNMNAETFRGSIQGQQLINTGAQYLGNEYLTFSSNTGAIRIAKQIDRDELCSSNQPICDLKYSVVVFDSQKDETRPLTLQLRVKDKNDQVPHFRSTEKILQIIENAATSRSFALPAAQDGDALEQITYQLSASSSPTNFQLRNNKLAAGVQPQLFMHQSLDFEKAQEYRLTLTACDSGAQCSVPLNILIKVQDQNDNAPVFLPPRNSYSSSSTLLVDPPPPPPPNSIDQNYQPKLEILPNGVSQYVITTREDETGLLLRLQVRDLDSEFNGQATFHLESASQNIRDSFSVNTVRSHNDISEGELVIRKQLNPNANYSPYRFSIRASDMGVPPMDSIAKVKVIVVDVNNYKPEIVIKPFFNKNQSELIENTKNEKVALIEVRDRDLGENARVNCHMGTHYNSGDFKLSKVSEELYTLINNHMYDCEKVANVTFDIICHDFGNPSLNETLKVSMPIADVNEFAPTFVKKFYSADIDEDGVTSRSTNVDFESRYVLSVKAIDKDRSSQLTYTIINDNNSYFRIDAKTGAIYTARSIDREQLQTPTSEDYVLFEVKVSDEQFSDMTSARVNINDINDNVPIFINSSPMKVMEDAPRDTEVGQVQALDADQRGQSNLGIVFSMVADSKTPFEVLSDGRVVLRSQLDRELIHKYLLYVNAIDGQTGGKLRHTSTGSVTIIVDDVNDNKPYFRRPERQDMSIILYDTLQIGSFAYKVEANDDDESDRQRLMYQLIPLRSNYFQINQSTGEITVAHKLSPGRMLVSLRVSDGLHSTDRKIYFNISTDENKVHLQRSQELEFNFTLIVTMVAVTTGICITLVVAIVLVRRHNGCVMLNSRQNWHQSGSLSKDHASSVGMEAVYIAADGCLRDDDDMGPLTSFGQPLTDCRQTSPISHHLTHQFDGNLQRPMNSYDLEVASADSGHGASEEDALNESKGVAGPLNYRLQTLPHLPRSVDSCTGWNGSVQPPAYSTLGRMTLRSNCTRHIMTAADAPLNHYVNHDRGLIPSSNSDVSGGNVTMSLARPQFLTSRLASVTNQNSSSYTKAQNCAPMNFLYTQAVDS